VSLALLVWAVNGIRFTRTTAAIALTAAVALVATGLTTGALSRFTRADAPHTGLFFRADEVHTALRLPAPDLILGQGIGGRFLSRDAVGRPVTTAWSHVLPVFIVLKTGLVGLGAAIIGLIALTVKAVRKLKDPLTRPQWAIGCTILLGLAAASMTLGRAQLPEGIVLIGLAAALINSSPSRVR
jgi:hypothetical protein